MEEKRIEDRCRRRLARHGYALRKGKTHPEWNTKGYMIIDSNNVIVAGAEPYAFNMDLSDVVTWIEEMEEEANNQAK